MYIPLKDIMSNKKLKEDYLTQLSSEIKKSLSSTLNTYQQGPKLIEKLCDLINDSSEENKKEIEEFVSTHVNKILDVIIANPYKSIIEQFLSYQTTTSRVSPLLNDYNYTLLNIMSCCRYNKNIAQKLKTIGISSFFKSSQGHKVLCAAIYWQSRSDKWIKFLINNTDTPTFKSIPLLNYVIKEVSEPYCSDYVKLLLEKGAEPNIQDKNNSDAIDMAFLYEKLAVLRLLLDRQDTKLQESHWTAYKRYIPDNKKNNFFKVLLEKRPEEIRNFINKNVADTKTILKFSQKKWEKYRCLLELPAVIQAHPIQHYPEKEYCDRFNEVLGRLINMDDPSAKKALLKKALEKAAYKKGYRHNCFPQTCEHSLLKAVLECDCNMPDDFFTEVNEKIKDTKENNNHEHLNYYTQVKKGLQKIRAERQVRSVAIQAKGLQIWVERQAYHWTRQLKQRLGRSQ